MTTAGSIVTDVEASARLAEAYWRALAGQAQRSLTGLGDSVELPQQSLIWPLEVYRAQNPSWATRTTPNAELVAQESAAFDDGVLRDLTAVPHWIGTASPAACVYVHAPTVLKQRVGKAFELIASIWPGAAKEAQALLRGVAFVDSARMFSSTSDPKLFGLLHIDIKYYADKSVAELATALVHEVGHHALFVATSMDPVIDDPKRILYSPFRGTKRPAIGVLHAAMALARMLRWGRMLPNEDPEACRIESVLLPKLTLTLPEIAKLTFTPKGQTISHDLMASLTFGSQ